MLINDSTTHDNALEITCTLDAPLKDVYAAWADPLQMAQWMGHPGVACEKVDMDLRPGGYYRIQLQTDTGTLAVYGEYREIVENRKLVFTWQWEDGSFTDSVVTVLFSSTAEGTAINLNHSLFPARENAAEHNKGWSQCLAQLQDYLERAGVNA